MKKNYLFILPIILIIIFSVTVYQFLIQGNQSIEKVSEKIGCERKAFAPSKNFDGWQTYWNDQACYSLQYPKNWQVFESFEHVGPYVAISNDENDINSQNPKIMIETMNLSEFAGFSSILATFEQAQMKNFWQGTQPAFRISGEVEKNTGLEVVPYTYCDFLILPRESQKQYVVLAYYEKTGGLGDRQIIDNIFNSFNIIDK